MAKRIGAGVGNEDDQPSLLCLEFLSQHAARYKSLGFVVAVERQAMFEGRVGLRRLILVTPGLGQQRISLPQQNSVAQVIEHTGRVAVDECNSIQEFIKPRSR